MAFRILHVSNKLCGIAVARFRVVEVLEVPVVRRVIGEELQL